jgi:hypothetical protein
MERHKDKWQDPISSGPRPWFAAFEPERFEEDCLLQRYLALADAVLNREKSLLRRPN